MEVVSYSQNTFFLFISEWFCHFMRIVILSSDWPVEVTCIMVDYKISFFFSMKVKCWLPSIAMHDLFLFLVF